MKIGRDKANYLQSFNFNKFLLKKYKAELLY